MPGVLAIDHGERKSGFAYSDAARILCNALDPAQAGGTSTELYDHLTGLLEDHDVGTLLVGLPLAPVAGSTSTSPSDRLGERARSVLRFADGLRKRFPELEICLYDECLTTKEAESRLTEAGYRGPDRKARLDSWSALVLLEDWLAAGEPR